MLSFSSIFCLSYVDQYIVIMLLLLYLREMPLKWPLTSGLTKDPSYLHGSMACHAQVMIPAVFDRFVISTSIPL